MGESTSVEHSTSVAAGLVDGPTRRLIVEWPKDGGAWVLQTDCDGQDKVSRLYSEALDRSPAYIEYVARMDRNIIDCVKAAGGVFFERYQESKDAVAYLEREKITARNLQPPLDCVQDLWGEPNGETGVRIVWPVDGGVWVFRGTREQHDQLGEQIQAGESAIEALGLRTQARCEAVSAAGGEFFRNPEDSEAAMAWKKNHDEIEAARNAGKLEVETFSVW